MIKTTTTYICDVCGKEIEQESSNYLKWHFTVKDYLGNGCAAGGETYSDVCDKCIEKLDKAIYETVEQIKKES